MNINEMRLYVMQAYPGPKWAQRVAKMPNNQVIAVFRSIQNRKSLKKEMGEQSKSDEQYRQMTLWEVFDI